MSEVGDKFIRVKRGIETVQDEVERLVKEARVQGFNEGLACNVKRPSDAQFRKDHKEPVSYGEDFAYVVNCRSPKTAAKLLECDEDAIEQIGIGWSAYEQDGEMTVGYYIGREVTPIWYAWGIYL